MLRTPTTKTKAWTFPKNNNNFHHSLIRAVATGKKTASRPFSHYNVLCLCLSYRAESSPQDISDSERLSGSKVVVVFLDPEAFIITAAAAAAAAPDDDEYEATCGRPRNSAVFSATSRFPSTSSRRLFGGCGGLWGLLWRNVIGCCCVKSGRSSTSPAYIHTHTHVIHFNETLQSVTYRQGIDSKSWVNELPPSAPFHSLNRDFN